MRQMAVVSILREQGEVPPTPLNRTISLKIRDQQEQELLNASRQFLQPTCHLLLDSDFISHRGDNITILVAMSK